MNTPHTGSSKTPNGDAQHVESSPNSSPAEASDPTSRRKIGRQSVLRGTGIALLAGLVAALILRLFVTDLLSIAIAIGVAVALGAGIVTVLLSLEVEDGRIEQEAEAITRRSHSS